MGYLRPTAIIVSSSFEDTRKRHLIFHAHERAWILFRAYDMEQLVSPVVNGMINNEKSFFVAWDGSKEGWKMSDSADTARKLFVEWLRGQGYYFSWVEIQYGGDDSKAIVLSHKDDEDE